MPISTIGNTSALAVRLRRGGSDAPDAPASAAPEAPAAGSGDEAVTRAMNEVNRMLDPLARGLQFSIDESTGKRIVQLVDNATNEVLRQLPSREMLAIARALDRVQGILFSAKA